MAEPKGPGPIWYELVADLARQTVATDLVVLDLRVREESRVNAEPAMAVNPTWLNEHTLAYAVQSDAQFEIGATNVLGKLQRFSLRGRGPNSKVAAAPPPKHGVRAGERLTTSAAQDESPTASPDGNWIAFSSNRDGDYEIYVVSSSGRGERRLTVAAGGDYAPTWSPDGKRIAFSSQRDGNAEIYVMNADGTGQRNVTNTAYELESGPSWSSRGIAYSRFADGRFTIGLMDEDGGDRSILTHNSGAIEFGPAWSPDGTELAYVTLSQSGNFDIYVTRAKGNPRRLTDDPGADLFPVWSPEGKRLAFTRSF